MTDGFEIGAKGGGETTSEALERFGSLANEMFVLDIELFRTSPHSRLPKLFEISEVESAF